MVLETSRLRFGFLTQEDSAARTANKAAVSRPMVVVVCLQCLQKSLGSHLSYGREAVVVQARPVATAVVSLSGEWVEDMQ